MAVFRLDRDDGSNGGIAAIGTVGRRRRRPEAFTGAIAAYRDLSGWHEGVPSDDGPAAHGKVTGPIRDVWNDPLVFVYGASDPQQTEVKRKAGVSGPDPVRGRREVPSCATSTSIPARRPRRTSSSSATLRATACSPRPSPSSHCGSSRAWCCSPARRSLARSSARLSTGNSARPDQAPPRARGRERARQFAGLSLPTSCSTSSFGTSLAPARGQSLPSFGKVLAAGFFDALGVAP
ncbi:MAG: hypothetical protein IPJ34_13065 [Myxococcales bacterium]|nr:hypothetical protein [Myxococcales bacterium]